MTVCLPVLTGNCADWEWVVYGTSFDCGGRGFFNIKTIEVVLERRHIQNGCPCESVLMCCAVVVHLSHKSFDSNLCTDLNTAGSQDCGCPQSQWGDVFVRVCVCV